MEVKRQEVNQNLEALLGMLGRYSGC